MLITALVNEIAVVKVEETAGVPNIFCPHGRNLSSMYFRKSYESNQEILRGKQSSCSR